MPKSTVEQIRERFDQDVERFSNIETGQSATMDAPLVLELITDGAAAVTPGATRLLDIGCGAGNYSVKMLQKIPRLDVTLIDLSQPMLDRAAQRVIQSGAAAAKPIRGDIRQISFGPESFDIVLAAAVLHHLRTDDEWRLVFKKIHDALSPGGSFWISDLIEQNSPSLQQLMWKRFGQYLTNLRDEKYRDQVFAYIEQEDSPRSLMEQLELLRSVGFKYVDVVHKNGPFAAFVAVK